MKIGYWYRRYISIIIIIVIIIIIIIIIISCTDASNLKRPSLLHMRSREKERPQNPKKRRILNDNNGC